MMLYRGLLGEVLEEPDGEEGPGARMVYDVEGCWGRRSVGWWKRLILQLAPVLRCLDSLSRETLVGGCPPWWGSCW